jgi:hypothetical protein
MPQMHSQIQASPLQQPRPLLWYLRILEKRRIPAGRLIAGDRDDMTPTSLKGWSHCIPPRDYHHHQFKDCSIFIQTNSPLRASQLLTQAQSAINQSTKAVQKHTHNLRQQKQKRNLYTVRPPPDTKPNPAHPREAITPI